MAQVTTPLLAQCILRRAAQLNHHRKKSMIDRIKQALGLQKMTVADALPIFLESRQRKGERPDADWSTKKLWEELRALRP